MRDGRRLKMNRLGFALTAILGLAGLLAPAPAAAQDAGVTGAAEATFPDGATFNGIPLRGLTLGQGLFIAQDGSATGQFQAVLLGTSLLGAAQNITVEGEVRGGSVGADGSATFSGTATVDMGDGTLPLSGVPFTATPSAGGIRVFLQPGRFAAAPSASGRAYPEGEETGRRVEPR